MLNERDKNAKKFLALYRREREIYDAIRNMPLVKLEEPIQKGWEVYMALSDEGKKHKHANFFQKILDEYTTNMHTVKVAEIRYVRKVKKYGELISFFTRYLVNDKPYYYGPEFKTMNLKTCQLFDDKYRNRYIIPHRKDKHSIPISWIFSVPLHLLILKVRPYMLTHRQLIDRDLESEKQYIHEKLWNDYDKDNPFLKGNDSKWFKHQLLRTQRKLVKGILKAITKGDLDELSHKKINNKNSWS